MTGPAADRDLRARVADRWLAIDPLLPSPGPARAACGADLVVAADDGALAAVGGCEHWAPHADSLDVSWGAARQYQLSVRVADLADPRPLDELLSRWKEHLRDLTGAADDDTAAVVTWPSRDTRGVKTLLAHGLAPLAVVAARTSVAAGEHGEATRDGLRVRRAVAADLDDLVRLGLEVVRFDSLVSGVTERPSTAAALRAEFTAMLADEQPWLWLAETDGGAVGMLAAQRPATARWIAPMARHEPVAYLLLMGVAARHRGAGIGAAMVAHLHREVRAAGVAVTLLHYAPMNPLSAPFWSQQGYRPLWTVWEAIPARTLR